MMTPKWKKVWLKALRSGEYRKGKNALKNHGEYCCLGVLCDALHKEGFKGLRWNAGWAGYETDSSNRVLPYSLMMKLGITDEDQSFLTDHNDGVHTHSGRGWGFKKIADWIEENL